MVNQEQSDRAGLHPSVYTMTHHHLRAGHTREIIYAVYRSMIKFSQDIWAWGIRLRDAENRVAICRLVHLFRHRELTFRSFMNSVGTLSEYIVGGYLCHLIFTGYVYDRALQRMRSRFIIQITNRENPPHQILNSEEEEGVKPTPMDLSADGETNPVVPVVPVVPMDTTTS
jgi:hypothetical protein